jgi:hypothetical protein
VCAWTRSRMNVSLRLWGCRGWSRKFLMSLLIWGCFPSGTSPASKVSPGGLGGGRSHFGAHVRGTCLQRWSLDPNLTRPSSPRPQAILSVIFFFAFRVAIMYTHIYTHTHTYIHTCMHTYIHAYIHTVAIFLAHVGRVTLQPGHVGLGTALQ